MTPDLINDHFMQFFRELYTSRATYSQTKLNTFLETVRLPVLDREDRERLEANISLEEIQTVIGKLQAGKTPRSGGHQENFVRTLRIL